MLKISTTLMSFLLLVVSATIQTQAENGYAYGLQEVDGGLAFGRVQLSSGNTELINPLIKSSDDVSNGRAAIDVHRNQYTYLSRDGLKLTTISLEDGKVIARSEGFDGRGLQYDPWLDRYYLLDTRPAEPGARPTLHYLLAIHPVDRSVTEVLLQPDPQQPGIIQGCKMFINGQRDEFMYLDGNNTMWVLSLSSGMPTRNFLVNQRLITPVFNSNEEKIYGILQLSPKGSIDPEIEIMSVATQTGAVETLAEIKPSSEYFASWTDCSFGYSEAERQFVLSRHESNWIFGVNNSSFKVRDCNNNGCFRKGAQVYNAIDLGTRVHGQVYYDVDASCGLSEGDALMAMHEIRIIPDGYRAFTDADGSYSIYLPDGTHVIRAVTNYPYRLMCDNDAKTIRVADDRPKDVQIDFGLADRDLAENLQLNISSSRMSPDQSVNYTITCRNQGSQVYNGRIRFFHDALLQEFNATPTVSDYRDQVAEWAIADLPIGAQIVFKVQLRVPADEELSGTIVCASVRPVNNPDNVRTTHNEDETCTEILSPYDVNHVEVSPKGIGTEGLIAAESTTLDYTIRFQNVGTAPVRNIVILDTLDERSHNYTTLHFGAASHDYSVNVLENSILEFRFNNINLPDKQTDEAASSGYVKFKVNANGNLPDGHKIKNRAAIYFDFNRPVITSTALNTISQAITDVVEFGSDDDELELRSLANGHFVLHSATGLNGRVSVYSVLGQPVFERRVTGQRQLDLNLSHLAAGRYLLRVESGEKASVKSLMILD